MSIKSKVAFGISIISSILITILCLIIFYEFSTFRRNEFKQRLKNRAQTTYQILTKVKEVDTGILREIQLNTVNQLSDESIQIYDENFKLIYKKNPSNQNFIHQIEKEVRDSDKEYFRKIGDRDMAVFVFNENGYRILVSAIDTGGNKYLQFLILVLIISYPVILILIWIFTFSFIKIQIKPLEDFIKKIKEIGENSLKSRISIDNKIPKEIHSLVLEFNDLLSRIDLAYENQNQFAAMASHELRTPLSRLSFKIQNQIQEDKDLNHQSLLKNLLSEVNQMAEILQTLISLALLDNKKIQLNDRVYLEELLDKIIQKYQMKHPGFEFSLNIEVEDPNFNNIGILSSENLLEIAFGNLIQNAIKYSEEPKLSIQFKPNSQGFELLFSNKGTPIPIERNDEIFSPFTRFNFDNSQTGSGLGLTLAKRIFNHLGLEIDYRFSVENCHIFRIVPI
ncbi:MAG: hypothetical protein RIR51_1430 [Bacteroidota bacterium]|jgi:signal transduction histidine kinase